MIFVLSFLGIFSQFSSGRYSPGPGFIFLFNSKNLFSEEKEFCFVSILSNEVILSLESIFDQNKNGDVEMKTQNKLIWNEIINKSHI